MTRPPVRFTQLKRIAQSPLHYRHGLTATYDSGAMRLGRLTDILTLGGELPPVWAADRRGKAWDAFAAQHDKREIVTQAELDEAQRMADAVHANRHARAWLEHPDRVVKRRIYWDDIGRPCSGEPDLFVPGEAVVDLKTTRSADPARFARDAIWRAYHAQLAWYRRGLEFGGYGPTPRALIIAVESAAPYPVTVLELTPRALEQGERLCRVWLERLLACEAADEWPGYAQDVVSLDVPGDTLDDLTYGEDT